MSPTERTGPLSDIRILDLTQALAGPFGTALLGDLGADVIKVEPPGGDMSRTLPPKPPDREGCDYGGYFASINRSKRSIVLDLKCESDRALLLDMVEQVDAVVENTRVGVMDRLGVGYETLRERNPAIVYAAIRGFGDPRTGESPYANWPAFDVIAQSMGGFAAVNGPAGGAGMPGGTSIGDIFPGTLMALGLVSAVHAARRTGEGQFLDVGMYDAVLALCELIVWNYSYDQKVVGPRGSGHPMLCPFDLFPAKDGAISIAAPGPGHWKKLCEAMGREDLIEDERTHDVLARSRNREFTIAVVTEFTQSRTRKELTDMLGGEVPVGPVQTAADIFADPHVAAREMLPYVELPGNNPPVQLPGTPIRFTGTPAGIHRRPPMLDEHREEILRELGLSKGGGPE
jgi:crotonobetainyl-CoA:carnitine CoA-transferase CaiB-like acyl-CoA transferase